MHSIQKLYLPQLNQNFLSGWGWGDPHYVPFDDKSNPFNTFNAPGDNYYNVVKITKSGTVVFTLQALINGLLIKSMAIGVQGMESYQVSPFITCIVFDIITKYSMFMKIKSSCLIPLEAHQ